MRSKFLRETASRSHHAGHPPPQVVTTLATHHIIGVLFAFRPNHNRAVRLRSDPLAGATDKHRLVGIILFVAGDNMGRL